MECPLFKMCYLKTAMCRCCLPDETCYWYRYFKKLIEENENKKGTKINNYMEQINGNYNE